MMIKSPHVTQEIDALLSFTTYGKMKLDTLSTQLMAFEKDIPQLTCRDTLNQFGTEINLFRITLISTLETIKQWDDKVSDLRKKEVEATKTNDKVRQLTDILSSQQNRIQDLHHRCERLIDSIRTKLSATSD
jgi:hypothetical protein